MTKKTTLLFFILIIIMAPGIVFAEGTMKSNMPLDELTALSQKLVDQTKNNQIAEARNTLALLSETFTRVNFDGIATVEGIEALSSTIIKTKHAFAPIKLQQEEALYFVTMLHLGIDALNHEQRPLWQRYDRVLIQDVEEIEKFMNNHQWTDVDNQLVLLQRHFELIRPAIFITYSAQVVQKMDSLVQFTQQQFNQSEVNHSQVTFALTQLKEALDALFRGEEKDVFSTGTFPESPILITFMVGSIVITVLSFVAWKRYRIEQQVIKKV